MAEDLEAQFHEQMLNIYRNALMQANYKATKFLEMVVMQSGLVAAKTLLHTPYLPGWFRGSEVLVLSVNKKESHLPNRLLIELLIRSSGLSKGGIAAAAA